MKTPKRAPDFDHQIFDLTVIGAALKDIHHRLATPVGGFPGASFMVFR
jgi:hypothetical protein